MDWQSIHLDSDTHTFYHQNQPLFGRRFLDALKFHAPGLAPVRDTSGWYHLHTDGTPLYPERYERAFGYYCDRAAVVAPQGWFHLNTDGVSTYEQRYFWCGNYQSDMCTVRSTDGYFHIDIHGERRYPENYTYAGDFRDGIACVLDLKRGYTHIRSDGSYLHSFWFRGLGVYHKGFATAQDAQGWFHIDRAGRALYTARLASVEPFYNGVAKGVDLAGREVVVFEDGSVSVLGNDLL